MKVSSANARRRMQNTRQRDTPIELSLRSAMHRLGLRFRLHARIIPNSTRTADIIFPTEKVAIFVDSCFWHCCPVHRTIPKANREWWKRKLAENRRRDSNTNNRLRRLGWITIRVWEHESFEGAAREITKVVKRRRGRYAARARM